MGGVARAGDCYWKATSTASFTASTSNWSCGAIPGNSDKVHFDTAGGGTNTACTIDSSVSFRDFDVGAYTGTVTINAGVVVTLNGNVAVTSTAPNALAGSGTVALTGTSTSGTVQSGTATFPALTVNASGGIYTLQDALYMSGALTMTLGTLTSGSKAVQVGSVSLGGGTFNASSGTTTVGGAFSKTGGTFSANGGTVKLTGSGSLRSGGSSFNALTVAASGTYTLQDNLTTTGAFTVSSGTLTAGSNAVQVASVSLGGGTFNASSGTTTVAGAFSNTGGTFNANGGIVKLTASGSLSSGAGSFNDLTVAASGTYTLGSTLLVGRDLGITSGTLAAGTQSISVGGDWSNAGTFTFTAPQTVTLTSTSSAAKITSGGSSFGALAISGVGGIYTLQDALAVSGNLSLASGSLTAGSFSVQVGGNVTVNDDVTNGGDPTLVGYWPLDETASPAADSSSNGNSLAWNSGPTATTSVPSAITFTDTHSLSMNGTTQYLATSSTLASLAALRPTTVTLSAWYKAKSVDTNGGELVSGSNTYGLRITSTGIMVMKRITDNTNAADWIEYRVPEANVLDGNWHQVVGIITTGTGGAMSVYFDGVIASGNYWVNGSSGASQLSPSTTPTDSTAAADAIAWDANTETFGLIIGTNPSTTGYNFGGGGSCASQACAIDDVRVYNRALTPAQVAALVHGNQPGGGGGVLSLGGSTTVSGSVSVQSTGTLTLASGATLALGTVAAAGALTMDGTLNSTAGTIKAVSASFPYAFKVGSTASAAPSLNINGLTVKNTDSNGMWINANTSAVTTFTHFDKVAFSNGTSGAGTALLNVNAASLYLSSNGCTFDGSTTYAVNLTSTASSGTGPRLLFGNATCATNDATTGLCATSEKLDDDSNNDGVVSPSTGGIVQFIRAAESDTDGTLVGFPTSAFNWNTFAYYATYVAFHDASSGSDVIYVRDEAGNPLYSWTDSNLINGTNETIVGTPQWITVGTTHYLYVGVNGAASNTGGVYRLIDTGTQNVSGTLTRDTSWPTSGATAGTGYFACSCTITSPLSLDGSNVYWTATNGAQQLFGITQAAGVAIKVGWPVTTPVNVTTSAPTLVTVSGTTSLYLAATSTLATLNFSTLAWTQDTPTGIGTVNGRLNYGTSMLAATNGTSRTYAGDALGMMWAVNPSAFSGTNSLWSYNASSAITDSTYDAGTDTIQFGTAAGKLVALTGAGAVVNTSYPYSLTSDPISVAPLYYNGVLLVGTTKGNLYFLDRNTGSSTAPNGVSLIKQVSFGPSEAVSTIAFDPNMFRYMVATSSTGGAQDGRLYYFDLVTDPTSTVQ